MSRKPVDAGDPCKNQYKSKRTDNGKRVSHNDHAGKHGYNGGKAVKNRGTGHRQARQGIIRQHIGAYRSSPAQIQAGDHKLSAA